MTLSRNFCFSRQINQRAALSALHLVQPCDRDISTTLSGTVVSRARVITHVQVRAYVCLSSSSSRSRARARRACNCWFIRQKSHASQDVDALSNRHSGIPKTKRIPHDAVHELESRVSRCGTLRLACSRSSGCTFFCCRARLRSLWRSRAFQHIEK